MKLAQDQINKTYYEVHLEYLRSIELGVSITAAASVLILIALMIKLIGG